MRANEDVEMKDADEEEEEEEEIESDLNPEEGTLSFFFFMFFSNFPKDEDDDDDEEAEDEDAPQPPLSGDRNSQLMVGYKGDRSYVLRGNNIGVFNHNTQDHSVKYYATIANVGTLKGKGFKPKHVCVLFLMSSQHILTVIIIGYAARPRYQNDLAGSYQLTLPVQPRHRTRQSCRRMESPRGHRSKPHRAGQQIRPNHSRTNPRRRIPQCTLPHRPTRLGHQTRREPV